MFPAKLQPFPMVEDAAVAPYTVAPYAPRAAKVGVAIVVPPTPAMFIVKLVPLNIVTPGVVLIVTGNAAYN